MEDDTFPSRHLSPQEIDARADFCRSLLSSASALAMQGFREMPGERVEMKGPQDFLTIYDKLVEEHIRGRIAEVFPDDGFLGEETGAAVAPNLWVVDPIDGTANFARGIPHFAVSIGFVAGGRILIGGLSNPALDETYFARIGYGAERNGRPIAAAPTARADQACVELGWSSRIDNADYTACLSRLLDLGANVRRSASGALGLAYVADGRSDAYLELHINAWDCMAGLLLAREAGALTNDFLEGNGLLEGNAIVAAAPGVADAVAEALGITLCHKPAD